MGFDFSWLVTLRFCLVTLWPAGHFYFFYGGNMEFFETYPMDKLIPYARNSRTHNDEQIAQLMASIKEFGFTNLDEGRK